MKGVKPGEKIELTRILELGSRDYTLRATAIMGGKMGGIEGGVTNSARGKGVTKGPLLLPASARSITSVGIPRDWQRHPDSLPTLADGIVKASLVVLEHTKGSMFEVYKFKKRKGYRRTLKSKLGFTKLRMGDIVIGNGEGIVE
jgi:large subunit ribosomal protein L21